MLRSICCSPIGFVKEMDLIGLEDDPDFWNMGLDSGSVEETSEPKMVDTQGVSYAWFISFIFVKVSLGNYAIINEKNSGVSTNSSTAERPGTKARPDGRYDCNHSCKDKSSCRHYWWVPFVLTVRPLTREN